MRAGRFLILTTVCSLATACAAKKETPSNVLLVTFDTTRADHLGYAVGREGLTPNLDRLARRGTWFSDCSAAAPITLVSHASLLTGLYPPHHGARDNGRVVPPETAEPLAAILQRRKFETHAVVSAFVLDRQFGLNRGFDGYDDDLSAGGHHRRFGYPEVPAQNTADRALEWLRSGRSPNRPFFLWIHFFDPHAPYIAPEEIAGRFPGDPYGAEIFYADREFGRVLDFLTQSGDLARTLVAFTSDHGESLGEHREKTHGVFVYEPTIHVPLLFSGPGIPQGARRDEPVASVDLLPTIGGRLGFGLDRPRDGVDLFGPEKRSASPRPLYFETMLPQLSFGWAGLRGLREGRLVAIDAPRAELYDVAADPRQEHNLLENATPPEGARGMLARLARMRAEDAVEKPAGSDAGKLTDDTKNKLASLGYLSFTRANQAGPRPDPKDRIDAFNDVDRALGLLSEGRYREAAETFQSSLRSDPGNLYTLARLGYTWDCLHERELALSVEREILRLDPGDESASVIEAKLLVELGRTAEARKILDKNLEGADRPARAAALIQEGRLDIRERRYPEAERKFRQALELESGGAEAAPGLAEALKQQGRAEEAEELLRREHALYPQSASISYDLGVIVEGRGDAAGAIQLYRAAVSADPLYSRAWNNLGLALEKSGGSEEALHCFERACEVDSENAAAALNLGARLLKMNQAARALSLFDRVVRLEPENSKAAAFRARSLQLLGRRRDALNAWTPLLDKVPVAWIETARLAHELGEGARARAALQLGIRRDGAIARQAIAQDAELSSILSSR